MIVTGFTNQAIARLETGAYNYTTNSFKVALYTSSANLGLDTTAYTTTGELSGGGYTAGGYALTRVALGVINRKLCLTWANLSISGITAADIRGIMIYNTTVSNEAVYICDNGVTISKTAATVEVKFNQAGQITIQF